MAKGNGNANAAEGRFDAVVADAIRDVAVAYGPGSKKPTPGFAPATIGRVIKRGEEEKKGVERAELPALTKATRRLAWLNTLVAFWASLYLWFSARADQARRQWDQAIAADTDGNEAKDTGIVGPAGDSSPPAGLALILWLLRDIKLSTYRWRRLIFLVCDVVALGPAMSALGVSDAERLPVSLLVSLCLLTIFEAVGETLRHLADKAGWSAGRSVNIVGLAVVGACGAIGAAGALTLAVLRQQALRISHLPTGWLDLAAFACFGFVLAAGALLNEFRATNLLAKGHDQVATREWSTRLVERIMRFWQGRHNRTAAERDSILHSIKIKLAQWDDHIVAAVNQILAAALKAGAPRAETITNDNPVAIIGVQLSTTQLDNFQPAPAPALPGTQPAPAIDPTPDPAAVGGMPLSSDAAQPAPSDQPEAKTVPVAVHPGPAAATTNDNSAPIDLDDPDGMAGVSVCAIFDPPAPSTNGNSTHEPV